MGGRIKQVIVVRKDLGMRRGKEIAQGAHASMGFLVEALQAGGLASLSAIERQWLGDGMAKICVQVGSEVELVACHERARAAGLKSHLVRDSGRTEFQGRLTLTACAIGPDEAERIDQVTGSLSLY